MLLSKIAEQALCGYNPVSEQIMSASQLIYQLFRSMQLQQTVVMKRWRPSTYSYKNI